MTQYDTVDTVSKLSDLRKATQICTGNSNLHINYVSMELHQMNVEMRLNSQAMTPKFPLTTPKRELLKRDKKRVKMVYLACFSRSLFSFIISHHPQCLTDTHNIAFTSQFNLN